MGRGKILNITLPDEMYTMLKLCADKKGLALAALIRLACSEYIEKNMPDAQNILFSELLKDQ